MIPVYIMVLLLATCFPLQTHAHQPVMDMAPRWEQGYGFQLRHESYGSDTLLEGNSKVSNPQGIERYIDKTWLEGVYTFERSKRVTFKIPYVKQNRVRVVSGQASRQKNSGWGDLILGLPLKKYTNKGNYTDNWGITPSIRIPTASSGGAYPISDGSWDVGLSLSYSGESYRFYQLYDVFYWRNGQGDRGMREGDEWGFDINLGLHPYHNDKINSGLFVMWDISGRHHENPNAKTLTSASGGDRIHTGPIAVWYYESFMLRVEYKIAGYEKVNRTGNSRGDEFQFAIGITF